MPFSDKYLASDVIPETRVLSDILAQGQLSGTSEVIEQYERDLAAYFGSTYALAVSSGSAALHTALHCLGVRPGDEVLIPAIAPIPTVLPILTAQATPVVVDVERGGFGFDVSDLRRKITAKTKAAIAVPLWGYPINYSACLDELNERGVTLIEDAAQAHGSKWREKHIGTFGHVGCFSTHDRKLLSTGEGGFILTDDAVLEARMRQFSRLGYMDGCTYGVNYKLSSLQAALGSHRLTQLGWQISVRTSYAQKIADALCETGVTSWPVAADARPNYYSLVLRLPWNADRNRRFIAELDRNGVPSDVLKYELMPIYKRRLFIGAASQCPNAEQFLEHITTVPVHPGLTDADVNGICERIIRVSHVGL